MEALQTDVISPLARDLQRLLREAVDRDGTAGDEPRRFIVQLLLQWTARCGRTRRKRLCMSSGPVNCEAR